MKFISKIALLCLLALVTAFLVSWYFRPDIRIVCLSSAPNAPQTLALWDGDGRIVKVNEADVLLGTGDTVEIVRPLQEYMKQIGTAPPTRMIKVTTTSEDENSSTVVEGWAQSNYLYTTETCPGNSES